MVGDLLGRSILGLAMGGPIVGILQSSPWAAKSDSPKVKASAT